MNLEGYTLMSMMLNVLSTASEVKFRVEYFPINEEYSQRTQLNP